MLLSKHTLDAKLVAIRSADNPGNMNKMRSLAHVNYVGQSVKLILPVSVFPCAIE